MGKEFKAVPDWMAKAQAESGQQEESAMAGIITAKVYNKGIGNRAVEDPEKAGKILIKEAQADWTPISDGLNLNILAVKKFYTGFVPRLNEFGDTVKDDNGNLVKDFYYTPEVGVFSKDNIPLGRVVNGVKEVVGRGTKMDFDSLCKSPKIDGQVNPLLKEMKTNDQTGEKYAVSYMKLGYVIYAKNLDDGEYIKIIPGGSYGRFNDVQPGTFEDLRLQAKNDYKEVYGSYVVESFIKTKVGVRSEGGFYYLDWQLDGFIVEDNTDDVTFIEDAITDFNANRFKGIDFDQPLQTLPYNTVKAIEAPKEFTKTEPVKVDEISVEDIPF